MPKGLKNPRDDMRLGEEGGVGGAGGAATGHGYWWPRAPKESGKWSDRALKGVDPKVAERQLKRDLKDAERDGPVRKLYEGDQGTIRFTFKTGGMVRRGYGLARGK